MSELEPLLEVLKTQILAIDSLATAIARQAVAIQDLALAVAGFDDDDDDEPSVYMDGSSVKTNDN